MPFWSFFSVYEPIWTTAAADKICRGMLEFGTCLQERIELFCICIEIIFLRMFMGSTFAVNIFSECVCEISYKASDDFIMKPPIINFSASCISR